MQVAFCAAFATALPVVAAAHDEKDGTALAPVYSVDVIPLEEGVWLHVSRREIPPYGQFLTTGLIVMPDEGEGLWLVDTAWTDEQTDRVLEWAEAATGRPVTHAVVTHAHDDKMGGMGSLREAGVETYALAQTNALAQTRGLTPAAHDLIGDTGGTIALPSGTPGGIELFYPGAAHTTDNIVAYVARTDTLFGGCMIRPAGATNLGNTADGNVAQWAASAQAVTDRYPDTRLVVPSHGWPRGPDLLRLTKRLATEAAQD